MYIFQLPYKCLSELSIQKSPFPFLEKGFLNTMGYIGNLSATMVVARKIYGHKGLDPLVSEVRVYGEFTCSFCHLDFVTEFPRFEREISAKIG